MQQSYGAAAAGKSPCLAAVRKLSDISPTLLELPLSSVVPVSTYVCFCFCNENAERVCPSFLSLQFPPLHLRSLVSLAIPSVLGALLSVVINIVNLSFVGHLSPELLGGAALGNALMLITGQCVLLGLCSAIDTLCAQAHGAGQSQLVGLIAQRACVAFTLVVLPILAVWSRTEQLLLLAAQEPRIAALAGEYVWYCLPTIFPILYSEIIKRYLQAQSIITPQIYVALVSNCVHAAAAYLLMFHFNMGLQGAAVGLAIGLTTNLVCWLVYLLFFNRRVARRTCPRINLRDLFSNWMPLWKYGIPGFMMMFAEWASFESVTHQPHQRTS
jgi:MATE family multidrug resistance protein